MMKIAAPLLLALTALLLPSLAAADPQSECLAGNGQRCMDWGDAIRATDLKVAFTAWQKACDLKVNNGCNELMNAYDKGLGVATDPAKATALAEAGCATNSAFACGRFAKAYMLGLGAKKAPAKAYPLYEKGCELGSPYSCSVLGTAYAFGDGLPKDVAKGKPLLEKACTAKYQSACKALDDLAHPPKASSGGGVCPGTGEIRCGGRCVDSLSALSKNCGGCGNVCPSGFYCRMGGCATAR